MLKLPAMVTPKTQRRGDCRCAQGDLGLHQRAALGRGPPSQNGSRPSDDDPVQPEIQSGERSNDCYYLHGSGSPAVNVRRSRTVTRAEQKHEQQFDGAAGVHQAHKQVAGIDHDGSSVRAESGLVYLLPTIFYLGFGLRTPKPQVLVPRVRVGSIATNRRKMPFLVKDGW